MFSKTEKRTPAWTPKCKWENNIKKDFKERIGKDVDWV
jgi:hypothetical protein